MLLRFKEFFDMNIPKQVPPATQARQENQHNRMLIILRTLLSLFIVFVFVTSIQAQKKVKSTLANLAPPDVCGVANLYKDEILVGTSVKRIYDSETETKLTGFTLRAANNDRFYLNVDTEHVLETGATTMKTLTDYVKEGRKVKVYAYRCRRILYVYKVQIY